MVSSVGHRLRSRLVGAALAVVLAASVAACGATTGPGNVIELTYVSSGGTEQEAMIEAWQQPYSLVHPGVRFFNTSPPDLGQIKAQVEAEAVGWNLVAMPPWAAIQNCGTLYERLAVPNLDLSQFPPDTHGECFVAGYRSSLVFTYNTEKWPDSATAPQTIQDFFDVEKFPGRRGVVPALADGILELALLADGVDPASLYPLDVPRALAKWETIRASTTWAAGPDALLELVTSEQVDMQLLVQSHAKAALDAEAPIAPVWDVTMTSVTGIAVPLGAPHKVPAEEFLSFLLQPEQQAKMAEVGGVAPVNREAEPEWSETGAVVNGFGSANTGSSVAVDPAWWSQQGPEILAQFNAWRNPPPPPA